MSGLVQSDLKGFSRHFQDILFPKSFSAEAVPPTYINHLLYSFTSDVSLLIIQNADFSKTKRLIAKLNYLDLGYNLIKRIQSCDVTF